MHHLQAFLIQNWPDSIAQAMPSTETIPGLGNGFFGQFTSGLGASIPNLLGAILILFVGWIVATLVASLVGGLLKKANFDRWVARTYTGRPSAPSYSLHKWIATAVYWIILLVAVVAFLDALKLTAVAQPLNGFLGQVFDFLPRLGAAAVLAAVGWLVAMVVKTLVLRTSQTFGLDEKLSPPTEAAGAETVSGGQFVLSETLANALYWFVLLLFLPLILKALGLQGALLPVENLLNDLLSALPRILKAVLIGAVGWLIARVVRGIVTNLLAAMGTDRLGQQLGLRSASVGGGGQSLSGLIGTITYVLILIPAAVAALEALQIASISDPAVGMLRQVMEKIPQILTAGLVLVGVYLFSRFVAELVTNIFTGIGFNNVFTWLGIRPVSTGRTPSQILGTVAQVGVTILGVVIASDILAIDRLTEIVTAILLIAGQVLVGLLVFAVGLYLANLAFNLIASSGSRQALILGNAARIAILALVCAMALQQIGVASNIINLAFGLLLGGIAVAVALAFGLGGRDVAGELLRSWLDGFRQARTTVSPTNSGNTGNSGGAFAATLEQDPPTSES